jgi:hypothetical protein
MHRPRRATAELFCDMSRFGHARRPASVRVASGGRVFLAPGRCASDSHSGISSIAAGGLNAICPDKRLDHRCDRCDLLLSDRPLRPRRTTGKSAEDFGGTGLRCRNLAAVVASAWRKLLLDPLRPKRKNPGALPWGQGHRGHRCMILAMFSSPRANLERFGIQSVVRW